MYDVLIIGGGVIGCSMAHELAKYQLKIILLEKGLDVCEATSMANSAIVHSGYDPLPNTLHATLNVEGNKMMDQVCHDLDVEFQRIGSLTLAFNDEEVATLNDLIKRGQQNGVPVELWDKEKILKEEPCINNGVKKALFAPTCGIVNPFELTIALMENAMDNGAELALNHEVTKIKKVKDHFEVTCANKKVFEAKIVVNAAGLFSGKIAEMIGNKDIVIRPRKGEYYVLDHFEAPFIHHTLFPCPTNKGKGVLVTPTTHGNYLVGPSSEYTFDAGDVATDSNDLAIIKTKANAMVNNIPFNQMIRVFAGDRAVPQTASGDFIVEEDKNNPNFYHAAGIQSPGLASSLAIANRLRELMEKHNKFSLNKNYVPTRRPLIRLNKKSIEERQKLIAKNPKLGKIICRCEIVSEGEIVDIIHRNCGATTIKGVKKRVRPGFGKCQGGFCEALVLHILARELHQDLLDIDYGAPGSYILLKKTKEEGEH
ncbi:MAG: NAD(P)/FAD-dependent oxidoreductase [Bacilli bacterium]|nr:NAD(P)/FAD-dependent oxidoreductase [Bacilli bacterium]MDD4066085.1 NAD(P)/FAD-dependent oxidoreductase [Bacilli bacterium]